MNLYSEPLLFEVTDLPPWKVANGHVPHEWHEVVLTQAKKDNIH